MFCNNCGRKLEDFMKFCPDCGSKTFETDNNSQQVSSEDKKNDSLPMVTPKEIPPLDSPENQPQKTVADEPKRIELPIQLPIELPAQPNDTEKPVAHETYIEQSNDTEKPVTHEVLVEQPKAETVQITQREPDKQDDTGDVPFQISFVNHNAVDEKKTQTSLYGQPPYYPYPAGVSIKDTKRKRTLIIVTIVLCIAFLASSFFFLFFREGAPYEDVFNRLRGVSTTPVENVDTDSITDTETTLDTTSYNAVLPTEDRDTMLDTDTFIDTSTDTSTDTSFETDSEIHTDTNSDTETDIQIEIQFDEAVLNDRVMIACNAMWKDFDADTFVHYTMYNIGCQTALGNVYDEEDFKKHLSHYKEYIKETKSGMKGIDVSFSLTDTKIYKQDSDKYKKLLSDFKDIYTDSNAIMAFAKVDVDMKLTYQGKSENNTVEIYCIYTDNNWYTIEE